MAPKRTILEEFFDIIAEDNPAIPSDYHPVLHKQDARFVHEVDKTEMLYSYFMDTKACEAKYGEKAYECLWYIYRRSTTPEPLLEFFNRRYEREKKEWAEKASRL